MPPPLIHTRWAIALLGMALSLGAGAGTNWYQVAVVVFAQPIDTDEDLSDQPPLPWPAGLREPTPVPASRSGLRSAYERLRHSRSYRPLLHLAWNQPTWPNRINAPYHVGSSQGPVEGVVRLQRGQYLHVIVDMEYRAPDGLVHRLREKRRVKFDEVHYLDHPAFGVLILVSPGVTPRSASGNQ